jgi:rfaE bifunctional protein kinase chain/domain
MNLSDQTAIERIRAECPGGGRIVFVSGNFNVLHPGHLRLLHFAADCGDYLVVGVNPEGAPGAHLPAPLRLEAVTSIGCVNHAFLLAGRPETFIEALEPDFVVKGKEHEAQFNPEQAVVDSYGGLLLFSSGELTFSSIELLRREFNEVFLSTIVKPRDYPERHGFSAADLKTTLKAFQQVRVLIIGDLIVDQYIACDPIGMSQEDPTIVVTPVFQETFVGGAGIVAGHAAGMGAQVSFLSVTGEDATAEFAVEKIQSFGVDAVLIGDETRPTTLKQRYRAAGKTLLRVSHLKRHELAADLQARLLAEVEARISDTDLIVFSDFNYGTLPQWLVDQIVILAGRHGIPMVADSQSSSQVGDVSRFTDMLLLKPTEREARLALRDFQSGLVVVAQALADKSRARNIAMTLGSEGVLVHSNLGVPGLGGITDKLPAFNHAPKDAAGAGDSFLVCASLALAAGADIWQSSFLGSIAAACQVGRIGNIPITAQDLIAEIDA